MKSKTQGFTLIELLIVIAIIGILAAVLIPNLLSARTRAQTTAGQSYAREVLTALENLQSTNTAVSYSETIAAVAVVSTSAIQPITIGLAPNTATFADTVVGGVLKAPTNGITKATYYGAGFATVGQRNRVYVEQTINALPYCSVLDTATNNLATSQVACP